VYVVDTGNHRIQLFDLKGNFIKSIGGFGFEVDQFDRPLDIWVRSLINIYVSDYNNQRLQRFDGNMNFLSSLLSNEGDAAEFQYYEIASCAVNSQKDLFLLDHGDNKIIKINRNGQSERSFGAYEAGEGELTQPVQLDIWKQKYLLVSDISQSCILLYDFFGNFIRTVSAEEFVSPTGIATTSKGEVFVADPSAKQIFWISAKLDSAKTVGMMLTKDLTKPQDVGIFENNVAGKTQTKLYIIDENEIIIGKLVTQ
jgi:DNA-binding beta-propeller fold protein YncE